MELKEKAKIAPTSPGCYLWKNSSAEIIYIGKAKNLKKRIASYLRPLKGDSPKNTFLKLQLADLEWIVTETENEALLLEDNLIKKHQPKYNIRLTDDKRYPYLCLSLGEMYPRLYITRRKQNKKHNYYGPYTNVKSIRMTLNLIHKLFPLRKKNLKFPLPSPRKPCLNYHIERCLAPCTGKVSEEDYKQIVNQVMLFLEGRHSDLKENLFRQMQSASDNLEFEKAARLRDTLEAIKAIKRKSYIQNEFGNFDIMHFARKNYEAELVFLEFREGKLAGKKDFPIRLPDFKAIVQVQNAKENTNNKSDILDDYYEEILESGLREYYSGQVSLSIQELYIPYPFKNSDWWQTYLSEKFSTRFRIIRPSGGPKKDLLNLAKKNADFLLSDRLLQEKSKDKKEALKSLADILNLKNIPHTMECYDISHFQGVEPVASGVFFKNGKPHKSSYRRYIMKGYAPGTIDDPGMIHEVISRRMEYLINEQKELPDLIIIDGGKTQLSAAVEAMELFNIKDVALISLAKQREEIYLPYQTNPLILPKSHKALLLLQNIRDEAHRFAVTFHKQRRNKAAFTSALDGIKGLGEKARKEVLTFLSNIDDTSSLTQKELQKLKGIGPAMAEKILEQLKSD